LTIRLGSTFFDIYARFARMWYYSSRRGVSTQSILIVTRQADAYPSHLDGTYLAEGSRSRATRIWSAEIDTWNLSTCFRTYRSRPRGVQVNKVCECSTKLA
jgi:hypothetical protein